MNWEFLGQLFATGTGLAAVAKGLAWLNTKRAQRLRATGEAGVEYDKFMGAAMTRANEVNSGIRDDLIVERRIKSNLIDLVFDLVDALRNHGASAREVDPYLDRLDEIRADR
ncbi:hypothetical protein [Mycobacterium aquaticum]|uniref:hypothetical protein n=1 Tax=Mycobacterium aquaticum TaxID=1927124 RepID=UPI00114E1C00|nr:hypothetical protein [Mycobacterium aquaticum]